MKIYIGPYRSWFGPYQLAALLLFWKDSEDAAVFNFGQKLASIKWLSKLCDWVYAKKDRRIKIRIDDYDTWNMDYTLALIITPMLKKLKTNAHGAPIIEDKDVPVELRSTSAPPKESEWDTDGHFFKRWEWVLDEMIWTFEQARDNYPLESTIISYKSKEYKDYQKRLKNGFRLFGKYFRNLWD
jgi:hypothetical protein